MTTASFGLAAVGLAAAGLIVAVYAKELLIELCRLARAKANYWDSCAYEKDEKSGRGL